MNQKQLGHTMDGYVVYDHNMQASYPETLPQILGMVNTEKHAILAKEITLPTDIGFTQCVLTEEGDEIYYAKHAYENRWSRFVKNKDPIPTKEATIVLQKYLDGYVLAAFQLGKRIMAAPEELQENTEQAIEQSIAFWKQHAWIDGSFEIDPRTITKENLWWGLQGSRIPDTPFIERLHDLRKGIKE